MKIRDMPLPPDVPLSEDEYSELDAFLFTDDEGNERLSVDEAHGFITALIVGHAPAAPEAWMKSVWGQPGFADESERRRMTGLLLRMFDEISWTLGVGRSFEPLAVEIEEEGETLMALEGWCFGFMLAVSADEERWNQLPRYEQSLLGTIARLALLHVDDEASIDEEEYDMLVELLPGAVAGLHAYWESNWG
jgi:uncharacterized protein